MNFNDCINYLLTTAQHSIFSELKSELALYDLTPVQYGVLNFLWRTKQNTPKNIAKELKLETSTISGILDRMEKKGFIVRMIDLDDRRQVKVELTDKSKKLEDIIVTLVEQFNFQKMSGFGEQEQRLLKKMLRQLSNFTA